MIVTTIAGSRRYFWVGRQAPKGWRELAGAMHIGRGIWLLPIEPVPPTAGETST